MTLSISVVSHAHGPLVRRLLESLETHRPPVPFEVLLTLNVAEPSPLEGLRVSYPVALIQNTTRRGFSRNHNRAFRRARGSFFCVLNPDIEFVEDVFPHLIAILNDRRAAVVAPAIVDRAGRRQDSFRKMPTIGRVVARFFGADPAADLVPVDADGCAWPDWIAGMFLLMKSATFANLGGFDERYFLYYEDVDLGIRCRLGGGRLVVDMGARVIHDARRESHRRWIFLFHHVRGIARFLTSSPMRQFLRRRQVRSPCLTRGK